jgi:3',5'-cyclic AMP phosphodiesterase CpdA
MRVAHFSDLHLLEVGAASIRDFATAKVLAGAVNVVLNRGRKYRVERFEALVDDLNAIRLDHAVCTGDLVNLGLTAEFELAARILARIKLGPGAVSLVPGNHDYYTQRVVRQRRFERAFEPFVRGDDGRAGRYPYLRLRPGLAIVGLCSAYPSPPGFADGRLGASQIARAEELLGRRDVRERFRLVLVHHPPVTHRGTAFRQLRDRAPFRRMLHRVGAELVLHGHDHRDERAELPGCDGSIPVIGVGSGSLIDERPDRVARYLIYDIEDRKLVGCRERVWDAKTNRFEYVAD